MGAALNVARPDDRDAEVRDTGAVGFRMRSRLTSLSRHTTGQVFHVNVRRSPEPLIWIPFPPERPLALEEHPFHGAHLVLPKYSFSPGNRGGG